MKAHFFILLLLTIVTYNTVAAVGAEVQQCPSVLKQADRNSYKKIYHSPDYEAHYVGNSVSNMRWFQDPLIVLLEKKDCSIAHIFRVKPEKNYYGVMYHDVIFNKKEGYIYVATYWFDNNTRDLNNYLELYDYDGFQLLLKRDYTVKFESEYKPFDLASRHFSSININDGKSMLIKFGGNDKADPFYVFDINTLTYDGYYQVNEKYFEDNYLGIFKKRSFDSNNNKFSYIVNKEGYKYIRYDFNLNGSPKHVFLKKDGWKEYLSSHEYEKKYGIKIPNIPYHKLPSDDPIQGRLVFEK